MSEQAVQARLRLWLHAEKAMGLRSVVAPAAPPRAPIVAPPPTRAEIPVRQETPMFFEEPTPAVAKPAATVVMPAAPFTSPILPTEEKKARLAVMDEKRVKVCRLCRLCETRTNTVFGEGDPDAKIFFIGEGPGENEDLTGRPFVGRAGNLLEKMILAMGLERKQVFIGNIVKCRPPQNRVPAPDEVAACTPYLLEQLEIIRPRVIVTLGLPAAKYMLQTNSTMGRMRGQWHSWRGIKLMPTFHPAFLLRSYTEENRKMVWSDLQMVMKEVGLKTK
jgi:uracil-DNA glycosylase family 4